MNKKRRETLKALSDLLDRAYDIICDIKYEEQDSISNMPENLENSDRYKAMEDAVDHLDDAASSVKDAESHIWSAMG